MAQRKYTVYLYQPQGGGWMAQVNGFTHLSRAIARAKKLLAEARYMSIGACVRVNGTRQMVYLIDAADLFKFPEGYPRPRLADYLG